MGTRPNRIGEVFQTAVRVLYPPCCVACGAQVDSDFGLCAACWRETPFIGGTVCETCGIPLPGEPDGQRLECDDCMAHPRPWTDGRAALMYQDLGRKLVLALKHGDRSEIAAPASRWLAQAIRPFAHRVDVIAPVPLHWMRFVRRRYNQSALLAKALGAELGKPVCPDLLKRQRRTASQDGKSPVERSANLEGAIIPDPRRLDQIRGRAVLLVDDVMTSGATFSACATACLDGGAVEVMVVALALVAKGHTSVAGA